MMLVNARLSVWRVRRIMMKTMLGGDSGGSFIMRLCKAANFRSKKLWRLVFPHL